MDPGVRRRRWRAEDVPALWEALYQSIHVRAGQEPPPRAILDDPPIAHYLRDFGSLPGDDAEVAVDGAGDVVGAIFCRRLPADDRGYGFVGAHIPELGMAVWPHVRGRGIGSGLLGALIERHPTISLSVDRDNNGAHALYRRLGFVELADDGNSITMLRRPTATEPLRLVPPSHEHLAAYVDALRSGWSPNTMRPEAAHEALADIDADAEAYLATLDDPLGLGPPIPVGDGFVQRLPGIHRWIWDGEFCGSISVRWQPGTPELPAHVLGHIGYTVVPWKQRLGYATRALAMWLDELRVLDVPGVVLPFVELTTDVDNAPSQRVILANGGLLVERFELPAVHGDSRPVLRFRIDL